MQTEIIHVILSSILSDGTVRLSESVAIGSRGSLELLQYLLWLWWVKRVNRLRVDDCYLVSRRTKTHTRDGGLGAPPPPSTAKVDVSLLLKSACSIKSLEASHASIGRLRC